MCNCVCVRVCVSSLGAWKNSLQAKGFPSLNKNPIESNPIQENRESVHWRHVSYANMQHTNPCSFELCSLIMNITQKNKDSAKNDKDYAKNGNKSI